MDPVRKAIEDALRGIRELGTPEELEADAQVGRQIPAAKANAHIHLPPNFSAFNSVRQAVELSAGQGLRVLGGSNYYDFSVYAELAAECRSHQIFPLFGLEVIALLDDMAAADILINDPGNPGKMYLCGKGIVRFNPMTRTARELMTRMRRSDSLRMRWMIRRMEEIFASCGAETGLTAESISSRIAQRSHAVKSTVCLQERHVAQAFQEALFELFPPEEREKRLTTIYGTRPKAHADDRVGTQNEIRSQLMKKGKRAFVPESFVDFSDACRLILELGGIPCYPTLADGTTPICAYEDPPEKLVDMLLANRVYCAEFIPIRNKPEVLERYVRSARTAGLVITAGTEHNTLDLIPMEPSCIGGTPVPDKIKEIFWEGACVVAAHQFLRLHGRCGYVDDSGDLNPAFPDRQQRIDYFRSLGAAVIARYDEQYSR
ncbi:MAG TPA: hypothetical protein VE398_07985 [Acidobacteriota bacterium]|nr:hypothetical protein [Acidobacteriota bacterium]